MQPGLPPLGFRDPRCQTDPVKTVEIIQSQAAAEPARQRVQLRNGPAVEAVAYVIDPGHLQYTGPLSLEDQARIIAGATGGRGRNCDYLWSTVAHLGALGLPDPELDWLAERVRTITSA